MHIFTGKKLFLFIGCFFLLSTICFADKKKKTSSQYQRPNIIKRAWGDLTTRNNYYFNANELYKEIVKTHLFKREVDYNKLLPFYYHDQADFSSNAAELELIAKKTGIVLQLHDYSRWRDNAFLLLGKSQFLRKQYDTSLITFQYIVTTMKPGKLNMKLEFSNKDRLKYLKQREKELAKKSGQKKKIIEFQYKLAQEQAEQKAEDAREKQKDAISKKKKELEEIIKAKKKILELQKKGKKIPPELIAKAKGKSTKIDSSTLNANTTAKKQQKLDFSKDKPYILLGDQYVENPYYVDSSGNRNNQNPLKQLDPKKEAKLDKLTFWEKIKHKISRPEALVWMSKSLIEMNNFADAKSMISYGKALRKLTKTQRRDFYLIDAYYNIRRNDYSPAIEELENALLYFKKKKDKAYYEYLLAQLYQKNNQPADAVDYFVKAGKHTKTEDMLLFSKIQLANIYSNHPDLADEDVVKMLTKLIKLGKNKEHADEVLYTLANYHYHLKDTASAIAFFHKSIHKSFSDDEQKGKSFLRLGEIYFDKEAYADAAIFYDSAIVYLPKTFTDIDKITQRKTILNELAANVKIIQIEDSLQTLGKMKPADLEKYLAKIQAEKEKLAKKKSRFSSDIGNGNASSSSNFVPESGISNGLWYFYNPEAKSKGYNDFISIWGDRKLEPNWRRSDKSVSFDDIINSSISNTSTDTTQSNKQKSKTKIANTKSTDSLKIPKTPEDFIKSDKKIADAFFVKGEIFKNKLNNLPKAKQAFDELTQRFPNSEYDAKAHYYQYLMYSEKNLSGLADKEKNYILENYPLSDVAEVLQKSQQNIPAESLISADEKLYASTYQDFLSGNYDQVIKNKFIAQTKYPSSKKTAQFNFLEAVSFGKLKQFDNYKRALSDIIVKEKDVAIKQKAQEYLISYIQFENKLKDTAQFAIHAKKDTLPLDTLSAKFTVDTNTLWVMVRLKDKYMKVLEVKDQINTFNKKHFNDFKLKVNPIFLESFAIMQIKKFEGITEAKKYLDKMTANTTSIFGKYNEQKVSYYIITSSNFKLIKQATDFDIYERYFNTNYPK
ncbi:MAG: tetratricopeptide repeat protein [Chitinophagales bacterium]|jgi:tetratricopeptide (TPR) repeat protein|nr:tetratricopeptide repeat protein [Chitinophagales bacterium]